MSTNANDTRRTRQKPNWQRRQRAIELLAAGWSTSRVAAELGVTVRCVQKWRTEHAAEVEQLQREQLEHLLALLRDGALEAAMALREVTRDPEHPARVTAASRLLEHLARFLEVVKFEQRVAELEAQLREVSDAQALVPPGRRAEL
mgnify:CR=1 FL=1